MELSLLKVTHYNLNNLTCYFPEWRPEGYRPGKERRDWFRIEWPYVIQCQSEQEALDFLKQFPLASLT